MPVIDAPKAANDPYYDAAQVVPISRTHQQPLHTLTNQSLSPTSEFMRYVLAALPSRYTLRGLFKTIFDSDETSGSLRTRISTFLRKPGAAIERWVFGKSLHRDVNTINNNLKSLEHGAYGVSLGLGSMVLTYSYSRIVAHDIQNLFAETVAEELNKPAESITFGDIRRSQNKIIQRTIKNYYFKMLSRFATDLLFFPAAWMRKEGLVDGALGLKGIQLFMDTWKRKTTMFEDLVTIVNNKINPRNGLGQAFNVGEILDLYQHYTEASRPDQMFNNVIERSGTEETLWAQSQPIFQRMTDLLNLTYAYKHSAVVDPETGRTVQQADFALPKFIYLLGHDLIDVRKPEQTLATIEIANRFGIPAVKEMQNMLSQGASLRQVAERFPIPTPAAHDKNRPESGKNGVIPKGSTMQLDRADVAPPTNTIDAQSTLHTAPKPHIPSLEASPA